MNFMDHGIINWFLNVSWYELIFGMLLSFAIAFFLGEKINKTLLLRYGDIVYYYKINFSLQLKERANDGVLIHGYILTISQKQLDKYESNPHYQEDPLHYALLNELHLQYGIRYNYDSTILLLNEIIDVPKYKWRWKSLEHDYN